MKAGKRIRFCVLVFAFMRVYNVRENLRASLLAVNLAFSRVCGLFEDKV